MKAMIFAAGLGTRLKPLTDDRPKALVEIEGVSLLERCITRLKTFDCHEFIINVHHFAELITGFLKKRNHFDVRIEISVEHSLLDTGGGLKRAAWFFDDGQPFLVHNVDVLTDLDYNLLNENLINNDALAALAVRRRKTNRYFLFDDNMHLAGWQNRASGEEIRTDTVQKAVQPFSFMGIQMLSPEIFNYFPRHTKFSLVQAYLQLAKEGQMALGVDCGQSRWLDVGKPESLALAKSF